MFGACHHILTFTNGFFHFIWILFFKDFIFLYFESNFQTVSDSVFPSDQSLYGTLAFFGLCLTRNNRYVTLLNIRRQVVWEFHFHGAPSGTWWCNKTCGSCGCSTIDDDRAFLGPETIAPFTDSLSTRIGRTTHRIWLPSQRKGWTLQKYEEMTPFQLSCQRTGLSTHANLSSCCLSLGAKAASAWAL